MTASRSAVALALGLALAALLAFVLVAPVQAMPNVRLTNDGGTSQRPRVALDPQSNLIVVWQDDRFGNSEILWQKFSPLGEPLTAVVRITNTAAASTRPDVACDGAGTSHVCWQEGENVNGVGTVFFCRLDANGTKTLLDRQARDFSGHCAITTPSVGVTDLFFQRFTAVDQDVYYHRYNAAGTRSCERIFDIGTIPSIQKVPAMCAATGSGDPQLFWVDMTTSFAVHLRQGAANSACAAGQALAYNNSSSTDPATDGGGPFIYTLFTVGGNIYNFQGAPNACKLSQGTGTSSQPTVSADVNRAYGAWRETRDGNPEIYFATFIDCPSETGDMRLTSAAGNSDQPDIVVEEAGSGRWSLVWSDDRDGNREIYLTSAAAIAAPFPPADLSAQLTCPPGATLTWTDASSNETGFELQMRTGGGAWITIASPAAGATSALVPGLTYGMAYEFQLRSCNGADCSTWVGPVAVDVPAQAVELAGIVQGTLIERPDDPAPTLRGMRGVRVALKRGSEFVSETYSSTSDGSFTLQGPIECGDEVVATLLNATMQISATPPPAQCPVDAPESRSELVGWGGSRDVTWPVLANGTSGEGPEAALQAERFAREYWLDRLGVSLKPWSVRVNAVVEDRYGGAVSTGMKLTGGEVVEYRGCSSFRSRFAEVRDAIYHESVHRVVMETLGSFMRGDGAVNGNGTWVHPEAVGMDEGLADYFTASATNDPIIHHWSNGGAAPMRDIDPENPDLYPTCRQSIEKDSYFTGRILAGALWDLRELLRTEPDAGVDATDQAIFAAVVAMKPKSVADRTFAAFRDAILATPLGTQFSSQVQSAFAAHNIQPTPVAHCRLGPRIKQVVHNIVGSVQQNIASWAEVPGTHHYRIYIEGVPNSDLGLGSGLLVADDVVDTTFTHEYPDTSVRLSFLISSVDSSGSEGPQSDELPIVAGVVPPGAASGGAIAAWPNPGRGSVRFTLGGLPGACTLRILDVAGRRVRTLRVSDAAATAGGVTWDRRDGNGRRVPAGIYLVERDGARGERVALKLVLVE